MTDSPYFAARHAALAERDRLSVLEAELDPITTRHLRRFVESQDRPMRCLEVAGGGGSIARWLAQMVGPRGHVVATDVDTRFLELLDDAAIEVRHHDIADDLLETLTYDVVHCRLLLVHMPDVQRIIQKLADAVAPGGVLLLEEFEYATLQVADTSHPLAAAVTRVNDALLALTKAMGIDVFIGRHLPDLIEASGLVDVDHEATLRIRRGSDQLTMAKSTTALIAPKLLADGLATEADVDDWFRALSDPSFRMIDYALVSAWGRRPVL